MKKNVVYQIRIDSRRATRRIRRAAAAAKRLKVALEAIQNTEMFIKLTTKRLTTVLVIFIILITIIYLICS